MGLWLSGFGWFSDGNLRAREDGVLKGAPLCRGVRRLDLEGGVTNVEISAQSVADRLHKRPTGFQVRARSEHEMRAQRIEARGRFTSRNGKNRTLVRREIGKE